MGTTCSKRTVSTFPEASVKVATKVYSQALSKLEALGLKMNEDFFVIQNVMDVQDGGFLY